MPDARVDHSSSRKAPESCSTSTELKRNRLRLLGILGLASLLVPIVLYAPLRLPDLFWPLGSIWLSPKDCPNSLGGGGCGIVFHVFSVFDTAPLRPDLPSYYSVVYVASQFVQLPLTVLGAFLLLRGRSIGGVPLLVAAAASIPFLLVISQESSSLASVVPVGAVLAGIAGVVSLAIGSR